MFSLENHSKRVNVFLFEVKFWVFGEKKSGSSNLQLNLTDIFFKSSWTFLRVYPYSLPSDIILCLHLPFQNWRTIQHCKAIALSDLRTRFDRSINRVISISDTGGENNGSSVSDS